MLLTISLWFHMCLQLLPLVSKFLPTAWLMALLIHGGGLPSPTTRSCLNLPPHIRTQSQARFSKEPSCSLQMATWGHAQLYLHVQSHVPVPTHRTGPKAQYLHASMHTQVRSKGQHFTAGGCTLRYKQPPQARL